MRVIEHGVLDSPDGTGRTGHAMPADHDEVRARRVAGQYPGGMTADDVLPDGHVRVFLLPAGQGLVRFAATVAAIRW